MILPIKKKWFDMILSGEKKEEYRSINKYYISRFKSVFGEGDLDFIFSVSNSVTGTKDVIIRNGYSKSSPSAVMRCSLSVGKGKQEWGASADEVYFILKIKKAFMIDTALEPGVWKKFDSSGYVTPGGDQIYECSFCGFHHVYGIESNTPNIACEGCHRLMSYDI